jgi:serine/threonine protein phosphatase PrpC
VGPLRVWLPKEERPGLAMTRSIGDHIVRPIGVIPTPDIHEFPLSKSLYILLICSDGVHEFIPNHELAQIALLHRSKKAHDLAKILVETAIKRWKKNDIFIDDCTCQVVYIDTSE